eukprot:359605-Chlamydomonas_euryale.AAC.1
MRPCKVPAHVRMCRAPRHTSHMWLDAAHGHVAVTGSSPHGPQPHGSCVAPHLTRACVRSARAPRSDRFIPSRATAARLDFSVLDREVAASEATRSTAEREVRCERS